ncbi:MAG: hypothetical protein KF816_02140 [Melioribacteraceae bacterium]|nr:hypothetical protein [Melioribacteraceae bacterium]
MSSRVENYLVPLLRSALSGNINKFEINHLVKIAHQFAISRLSQLISSRKISFAIQPHTISSIALDCIAEIFERDENNNFIELINYFDGDRSVDGNSDEQIMIHFRMLVFSKLKDGIFRIYREYDPVTSKILRNIKLIAKSNEQIIFLERFGDTFLSMSNIELDEHLPEFPSEELESILISRVHKKENIKKLLIELLQILAESDRYRKFYSLIDIALLLKDLFLKLELPVTSYYNYDNSLMNTDIKTIVERSILEIRNELEYKYFTKNKIEKELFDSFIEAIIEMLNDTYILNDGIEISHYDYLKKLNPAYSYEEYRNKHRIKFEYMVKLSKKIVVNNLKNEFD